MTKAELLANKIDIDAGIENCGGMEDFYFEIVDDFENEEKRDELVTSFENEDWETYAIAVHAIKGILRMIGAGALGDLAEKLQFAAEAKDADTIKQHHDELTKKVELTIKMIKSAK